MKRYLIDTNIVRYYIENNAQVIKFFNQCQANQDRLQITSVTKGEIESQYMELNPAQVKACKLLLRALAPIPYSDPQDIRAHRYRGFARWMKLHHTKNHLPIMPRLPELADSKIAITAMLEGIDIITENVKDFNIVRFFSISIYNPITEQLFPAIDLHKRPPLYWDIPPLTGYN